MPVAWEILVRLGQSEVPALQDCPAVLEDLDCRGSRVCQAHLVELETLVRPERRE